MQNKTEHKCINGDQSSPRNCKTFQNYQDKVFLKIFLYNDLQLLDLPPPTCISVRIVSSLPKTEESLGRTPSPNLLQQTD